PRRRPSPDTNRRTSRVATYHGRGGFSRLRVAKGHTKSPRARGISAPPRGTRAAVPPDMGTMGTRKPFGTVTDADLDPAHRGDPPPTRERPRESRDRERGAGSSAAVSEARAFGLFEQARGQAARIARGGRDLARDLEARLKERPLVIVGAAAGV